MAKQALSDKDLRKRGSVRVLVEYTWQCFFSLPRNPVGLGLEKLKGMQKEAHKTYAIWTLQDYCPPLVMK